MKFRAYCIIVLSETAGVLNEIIKISERNPSVIDGKGLFIATFVSTSTAEEITEYFKLNNRNFMVFELKTDTSGFHITKDNINEGLFGFLKGFYDNEQNDMTNKLMEDIQMSSTTRNVKKNNLDNKPKTKVTKDVLASTEEKISKMSKDEKSIYLNEIIDKGVENLTEEDKKILELLAK